MKAKPITAAAIKELKETVTPDHQIRVHILDESGKKMMPYSRRDYYKIWLTIGKGRIHYATRSIELTQPALIFSNPRIPYSYESDNRQQAYICIFTEQFLKANGRTESLQESPLFKIGSNPVFFLSKSQLEFIVGMYEKMAEEMEYKLESVKATRVASDEIDKTFRSSSIGRRL